MSVPSIHRVSSRPAAGCLRLGLCCMFVAEPIRFRRATASAIAKLAPPARLRLLADRIAHNAQALHQALAYCVAHDIGAFRINSQILPLKTHPVIGYAIEDLPDAAALVAAFQDCGRFARRQGLRLSFHPDQFVVLNSPRSDVVRHSLAELSYQSEVAEWVGADVINIHGGGGYGTPAAALKRLARSIRDLPAVIRQRLTLENDDTTFTPEALLPVCLETGVPLVYDVHHHRCKPDGLDTDTATAQACRTWNREPLFHVSSPRNGWDAVGKPREHHDFIDPGDLPECWHNLHFTLEVEAKAKEQAIRRLRPVLIQRGWRLWPAPDCGGNE